MILSPSFFENRYEKLIRGLEWCPPVSQAKTRDTCHGALLGAREPSQGGTRPCLVPAREPSQDTRRVPWGLAWCPRAKPRWHEALHGARPRAKPRCHGALLGAREPSQDTRRVPCGLAWCPRAEPRHATRAMWRCLVPISRAKTHDACHLPSHGSYNDPRYGARGCARTRDPCHDACHGPRHDISRMPRRPCHGATTPVMTHSMVVRAVPRHMVHALSGFRP